MSTLLVLQAVALGLLAVLVGALLRSHAEIVRGLHRLGADLGDPATGQGVGEQPVALGNRPAPRGQAPQAAASTALDVTGTTPAGDPVEVVVRTGAGGSAGAAGHDTLLAFLSSTCSTCMEFWRALRRPLSELALPDGTRLVVVAKAAPEEDVQAIRRLAPTAHPVVLSTDAWRAYGIPATPYFIHVDGATGEIVGQGSGSTWDQVAGLLEQAVGDAGVAGRPSGGRARTARQSVAEAEAEVDRRLLAAGIRPGDPRLYPTPEEGS